MFKTYYSLTKPGIIYGNLINALSGFLLACVLFKSFDAPRLIGVTIGTALVIASGCVINNFIDRNIDKHMKRTKKRALVTGEVSPKNALLFAAVLGTLGFTTLLFFTNTVTTVVGVIGFIDYVAAYAYWKRRSPGGTLVGSISGATPPLAGYVAVSGNMDVAAWLVFAIFVAWQMPHFYAISLYRASEYRAAGVPVMSVAKGVHTTKIAIMVYIVLFAIASVLLSVFGYTGWTFALAMGGLSAVWLWRGFKGFLVHDSDAWARSMFGFSLLITLVLVAMLPLGALLP